MRARYYSPALGRFISRDPIGLQGGLNPYAYADNNPVNNTDPSGLLPQSPLANLNNSSSYYGAGTQVAGLSLTVPNISLPSYDAITSTATRLVSPIVDALPAIPPSVAAIPALLLTPGNAGQVVNDQLYGPNADPKYSPIYNSLGPLPNGGNAPQHGGTVHNDAIDQLVQGLQSDPSVSNVRKNQQQVDVNGNKVGTNRPDVQYDQGGCHVCVEFDTVPRNSTRHGNVIRGNDPKTKIQLNQL